MGMSKPHRAGEAHRAAGYLLDGRRRGQHQLGCVQEVLELDLVHFPVAAHHGSHRLAVCQIDQGLGHGLGLHAQEFGHRFNRVSSWSGCLGFVQGRAGQAAAALGYFGFFQVGRVIASLAAHNGVLTGLGQHHELVAEGAADGAGVGLHHRELEAQALESGAVGLVHDAVAFGRGVIVHIKGVGVLHDEFPRPHDAEARPDLVAELGLHLVEVDGHVAVGADLAAHQIGYHLFVGGGQAIFVVVAVLEA
jgi:hypothetical protein